MIEAVLLSSRVPGSLVECASLIRVATITQTVQHPGPEAKARVGVYFLSL